MAGPFALNALLSSTQAIPFVEPEEEMEGVGPGKAMEVADWEEGCVLSWPAVIG